MNMLILHQLKAFSNLAVLQNLSCTVFAKDSQGKYIEANDVLAKNIGLAKPEDVIGLTDRDIHTFTESESLNLQLNDKKVMRIENTTLFIEPVTLVKNREVVLISQKAPLLTRKNKIAGIMGFSFIINKNEFYSDPSQKITPTLEKNKLNSHQLSARQLDCLYYLTQGMTAKQIAATLNLSHRTVESYLVTIKNKLNCHSRFELVNRAMQMNLFSG